MANGGASLLRQQPSLLHFAMNVDGERSALARPYICITRTARFLG